MRPASRKLTDKNIKSAIHQLILGGAIYNGILCIEKWRQQLNFKQSMNSSILEHPNQPGYVPNWPSDDNLMLHDFSILQPNSPTPFLTMSA